MTDTDTDTTGLTIQTFLPHLRDAMVFAVNRWNEGKLQHFETYFEISFQDYMIASPYVSPKAFQFLIKSQKIQTPRIPILPLAKAACLR